MALKLSKRSEIPLFRALDLLREVNERKADGEDVISLAPGQPSDGAPPEALKYAQEVIANDPRQGYTEAMGMPLLRDRIAVWYRDQYGVDLDYRRIAITVGASAGFILSFLSAFEVGDKVAMAAPGYPAYRNILKALGLQAVEIETSAETDYQPTRAHLEALGTKIDGIIIASPCNPAGTVIAPDKLEEIVAWCKENGVRIISDELYQHLTFTGKPAETVLRYTNDAVVLNSFSKYFALTGWRLGWMVVPEDMADRVKCLSESLFVSPPTLSQHVAYKVFDHTDVLDGYVARYQKNLDILKAELPKAGFTKLSNTKGAFYTYADVSDLTDNSEEFCRRMLDETGVAMTPGTDFDLRRGLQTVRITFAGATEDITEACRRLQAWRK
ncbi:MAG: aminotransferase class I/II-fold pyridoxal phosphate-dependent enzyme [Rhodospirillales bacterium]|nr:aminotransferase class I/II-fold pyridoxal phosphate-dependent enzyme [Rhodospirillales bacterium]